MPASDTRLLLCGWALVCAIPFWQVALTDAFELEWRVTAGTADADGVGGEVEEELTVKRVVPRVQWLESPRDVAEIVTAGEAAQGDYNRSVAVFLRWAVPRRHADHATTHPADDIVLAIASGRGGGDRHIEEAATGGPRAFEGARIGHRGRGLRRDRPRHDRSGRGAARRRRYAVRPAWRTSTHPTVRASSCTSRPTRPTGQEGQFDDDYVNLGRLEGNVGSAKYVVPAGTDLARDASVVIWCDRFNSAFGAAPLF
jgi:Electron transfer DM13